MDPVYFTLILPITVVSLFIYFGVRSYKQLRYNKIDGLIASRMGWTYGKENVSMSFVNIKESGQKNWQDMQFSFLNGFHGAFQGKKFSLFLGVDGDLIIQIFREKAFNGFQIIDKVKDVSKKQHTIGTLEFVQLEGNELSNIFNLYAKDASDPYYDIDPATLAKFLDTYNKYQPVMKQFEISGINNNITLNFIYLPLEDYVKTSVTDNDGVKKQAIILELLNTANEFAESFT